jgi:single-stranded DNA-specific DHH superfamily exonuclease
MRDYEKLVERLRYDALCVATYGTVADVQVQIATNAVKLALAHNADQIETLSRENRELREALENLGCSLADQRAEPWPSGTETQRLHYWRDKCINAAKLARTTLGKETP